MKDLGLAIKLYKNFLRALLTIGCSINLLYSEYSYKVLI